MIPLLWKELRENLKWALLALAVLGTAELYALYSLGTSYTFSSGITLCKVTFLTVTTFGCPITGFLLGLIQTLPELRRDRWAALLHRPVSRGVIFRGKAVAGLFLYLLATAPPFLLAVWLVATPGNFASPFVPEMVFPGTADICMGAAYYCAALAMAFQRGGWIGLRVLPLLAALHGSYFILDENLFYVAVEAAVLMALALFTAAWGAIHSQDLLRPRPWLGKAAFLAVIFYGACGLGDLGKSFLGIVASASYPGFERYELSTEGVPLHLFYGPGSVLLAVQDLEGKPVTNPQYQPDRVGNHIQYMNAASTHIGDSHGFHRTPYQPSYREYSAYLTANTPYFYPRTEQWFSLVKPRVMIGYLPQKKEAFSLLDQRGFQPPSASPEAFPPGTTLDYITDEIYCIRDATGTRYAFLNKRQIVDLPLPLPGPVYGVNSSGTQTPEGGNLRLTGMALGTGMAIYDDKPTLVTTLPYHQDVDRWGRLSFGMSGTLDRFYLLYEPSDWIDSATKKSMPSYLEELDRQGRTLHTYTLPPLPAPIRSPSWATFFAQPLQSPASFFGTMLYKKIGSALGSTRMRDDLDWQFDHNRKVTRETSLAISIVSLLLAGAALFWARKVFFSWPRALAWAGFVLAFNLAGFIVFRLASDWPRLVPCPRCAKGRPTDSETCPGCGAGWTAPPANGIEIFDSSRAEIPVPATL